MKIILSFIVVLCVLFSFDASAKSKPVAIKVVTYNLQGLPDFVTNLTGDGKYKAERLELFCKELQKQAEQKKGWDVVLLQEVWEIADREMLRDKCGYPQAAISAENPNSGLVILSKHALSDLKTTSFKLDPLTKKNAFDDGEALVQKGVMLVKITVDKDHLFWVSNTHFISQYPDKNRTYEAQRNQQFNEMVKFLEKEGPITEPLIIGGDFNCAPSGEFHEALWDKIPSTLVSVLGIKFKQAKFNAKKVKTTKEGKVDHLFFSSNFKIQKGRVTLTKPLLTVQDVDGHGKMNSIELPMSDHDGWETSATLK